jgi:hypothetical protein
VRTHRAAVQLHQSFYQRQPQAHTAATLAQAALGLGKGLEQPLERIRVDAQPGVSDFQHGAVQGPREPHDDFARLGGEFRRVDKKVSDHLPQARWITVN